MKIAEVLRAKSSLVATIHPEQLVATAVRDMKVHAVGALVVTRDQTHVDGIVSEGTAQLLNGSSDDQTRWLILLASPEFQLK